MTPLSRIIHTAADCDFNEEAPENGSFHIRLQILRRQMDCQAAKGRP